MSEQGYSPPPVQLRDVEWRRLDPRMLLVHPVVEVVKFLPVLIGILVLGSSSNGWWQAFAVVIPVGLGILRYFTTSYRITPTQVELQRGLLGRTVLTARLDRVRAVEVTSTLAHRALGLAKVEIGTGSAVKQNDESFTLDGLPLVEARQLRVSLLHRGDPTVTTPTAEPGVAEVHQDDVLLRLDPRWVRFAPLTTSGTVIAAAILAVFGQFADRLGNEVFHHLGLIKRAEHYPVALVVVFVVLAFLVLTCVFGVLGYLVTNWDFTLSRDSRGRSFHIRHGLFTTRETSLEVERVRGLQVGEPLGLRLAGAARLAAVVTGVSRKESGSTLLVPPAPRAVVTATGADVLRETEPLQVTLRRHGFAAMRRRYTRALSVAALVPVAVAALCVATGLTWWLLLPALLALPVAALIAADRYRRLGHALTEGYLVVRSGCFRGRRDVLQRTGIIGWNIEQSWFQRRAGLATLVATTAAGRQAYAALDIPEPLAIAVASEAVPGLLTPFLA